MKHDNKKLDRIRKLLALRDGAGTEGEAMAAAAQAGRLLAELGIEEGDVIRESEQDIEIGELIYEYRSGKSKSYIDYLCSGLGQLCGCFVYSEQLRNPVSWKIVGYRLCASGRPRDLVVLHSLFPAMLDTVESIKKARGGRDSGSYALGLVTGLIRRMNAEQNHVLEQIKVPSLVPLSRCEQAELVTQEEFKVPDAPPPASKESSFLEGIEDSGNVKIAGEHQAIGGNLALGEGDNK